MKEQITMIQQVLAEAGIEIWNLREDTVSSAELFFIRRRLDMRRMKETVKYPVTVYRPFQKDGKDMLGFSEVTLLPTQSRDEILAALKGHLLAEVHLVLVTVFDRTDLRSLKHGVGTG